MLKTMFALMFAVLFTGSAFAAVTVTKQTRQYGTGKLTRVVKIHWVADASGVVTATDIAGISGYLLKAVTNPGATAPTDNYDVVMNDKNSAVADAANGLLMNRDTTTTEVIYPVTASGQDPVFFEPDTYTFTLTNNSVNAALGDVWLYFVDAL